MGKKVRVYKNLKLHNTITHSINNYYLITKLNQMCTPGLEYLQQLYCISKMFGIN
jgi:hypothetical protein